MSSRKSETPLRLLRPVPAFLLLALLAACSDEIVTPVEVHVPSITGLSYTSFTADGFTTGGQNGAVRDLKSQTGSEWVSLNVFEFQTSDTSSDIGPNTTGRNPLTGAVWSTSSTEADLREGVRQARLSNLKIMLKPTIDLYSGEWRANIRPDTAGRWFRAYTAWILRFAGIANELNVEMLCVGTELITATQPQFTGAWHDIVDSIRHHYRGKLTYASNWNGLAEAGINEPEFQQVQFWNSLDFIGIDSYYPLTVSAEEAVPSLATGESRMAGAVHAMAAVAQSAGKPIILTETGIQSVRGALASPWDYSRGASPGATVDTTAQAYYYRVMIGAIGGQSWCEGMFWWNWESVPTSYAATNYTPRNKPAAGVLRAWYAEPVAAMAENR